MLLLRALVLISEGPHRRLAFACSTVEAEKGHGG
jgi:hypothetical protein